MFVRCSISNIGEPGLLEYRNSSFDNNSN